MAEFKKIKYYFGKELAELLAQKIEEIYPDFKSKEFIKEVAEKTTDLEYKQRVSIIAELLKKHLPNNYANAVKVLISILGPENPNETGMFKIYYWISPIAYFVERYGLENYELSIKAIEEITKRNTGEYAIRPYIQKEPIKTMETLLVWSKSEDFHLRRLASEGCRPRLPWASKIDQFIQDPSPIFPILENLKSDSIKFVQKSVANNMNDILKDNYEIGFELIKRWSKENPSTQTKWIIKHALRNELKKENKDALELIVSLSD